MSNREAMALARHSAPIFAALGDTTRLQLLNRLSDGHNYSISQLSAGIGQTRQGVTKHLRVLEEAGIVNSERSGRETRFTFAPAAITPVQSYLDYVGTQWDLAMGRLKDFVERQEGPG